MEWNSRFLLVGRRHSVAVDELIAFDDPGWPSAMLGLIAERGVMDPPTRADVFVFSRGAFDEIMPFTAGDPRFDSWLMERAAQTDVPMIDGTKALTIVHQAHGYERAIQQPIDGYRNSGYTIHNARHVITRGGSIRPAWDPTHRRQH